MGLRDILPGRLRKAERRDRAAESRPVPLEMERLESRTLLDASATLTGGVLTVVASGSRDRIDLSLDPASQQLIVRDSGAEVGRFLSTDVTGIAISASAGNDHVTIERDVLQPTFISGGDGNLVIQAGGGPTKIVTGNGNSKLVGGPAPTTFAVGDGNNTLISHSGQDILVVGAGKNTLFVGGNDTLAGVGPQDTVVGTLASADPPALPAPDASPDPPGTVLTPTDVTTLLSRAAAADPAADAIVAIVDRGGRILGVRVEGKVSTSITGDPKTLAFAIDGAVAEARTGAFFGNANAPLTSRTIQDISQSTITQREIESNPNITDPNSTVRGPGYVAPISIGGHFPPNIPFTPQVDLFQIEGTNRDSSLNLLPGHERFNIDPAFVAAGQELPPPPDAYGVAAGTLASTQNRGIGTLPGGIPIYKLNPVTGQRVVVGGIGVFFPGKTGFADEENSNLNSNYDPTKPDRALEAEAVAVAAVGGSSQLSSASRPPGSFVIGALGGIALPIAADGRQEFDIPVPPPGRIDLVGVTLDIIGPNGRAGPDLVLLELQRINVGTGDPTSGTNEPVDPAGDTALMGKAVPEGFLVTPHASKFAGGLTAADVTQIINQGIATAVQTRAAIRLPLDTRTSMVFAVADKDGDILGLYRMPDATIFSIDVAVAKARNVAYYANAAELQPADQVPGIPAGVAFTNRTFRYLAEPRYPEGIDGAPPGLFSILNDGGSDLRTGLNIGPPLPASAFTSVQGHDAFNPGTNFHDPFNPEFQNGIVFFPGSAPLYKDGALSGGFGVSGDGVDQDDVVTFGGDQGFKLPPDVPGADSFMFRDVRLPYQKFNRNPLEPNT